MEPMTKPSIQRRISQISVTLILAAGLVGSSAYAKKSTFVYCSEGSPSAFNPQVATDGATFNATRAIYNKLVRFKLGTTEVIPSLAESWDIKDKGKTYIFKLRKGVKWHTTKFFEPTRDFNADDVVFSFDRQRLKSHPYHKVGGGSYEYFNSMDMGKIIKNIVKVDDYTVRFELSQPEAPFVANLAMDFASIISKEYGDQLLAKKTPEKIDFEPVGTGPFVYDRYAKDQIIRFKANPSVFWGKPKVDRLVFSITTDPSVRYQKLKAGECHLIIEPAPADLTAMKKNAELKIIEAPGFNVGYLAMNVQKKPFDNVKVRQAVNYALNRDSYINAIYMGNAVVAKNPLPPTIWSYNKKVQDYAYNVKKAKQLLKEAGFPKGFETELWTLPVSRPYNPNGKKMGEMMQADLAKIGIKVKLISYDWPTYLQKSKNGEHQMLQLGWTGDNGDPDNFLNVLLGCSAVKAGANRARWCHKPFDNLVQRAKQEASQPKRAKLYEKAQVEFKKQAPWVPIAHSVVYRAMAKNVKGYVLDPLGGDYFHNVELD